jgi:hypothetical protein
VRGSSCVLVFRTWESEEPRDGAMGFARKMLPHAAMIEHVAKSGGEL